MKHHKLMRVEARQTKLQANSEAIARWHKKLFRAATELKRLTEQRKRLLKPKRAAEHQNSGDADIVELNDDLNNM